MQQTAAGLGVACAQHLMGYTPTPQVLKTSSSQARNRLCILPVQGLGLQPCLQAAASHTNRRT
jgi:hypothetical protein